VVELALLEDRALLSDMTPPTTTASVMGQLGQNGYYTSPVTIDFSATDPDNPSSSLTTEFSVNGAAFVTGSMVTLSHDGIYQVQYFSTDPTGSVEATHSLTIKIDQTAPVITLTVSPTSLWPPNRRLVPVHVSGVVTDNLSGVVSTVQFSVSDEYGQITPHGQTPVASNGTFSFTVLLQSSRLGQDHDGRQYTIFVTANDLAGNTTTASAVVTVPHDQGHGLTGFGGGGFVNPGQGGNSGSGSTGRGGTSSGLGSGHGLGSSHGHGATPVSMPVGFNPGHGRHLGHR
jgi:hypothetical protein